MARILVVDDSSDLREMIRVLLEDRGEHEAILSADGEDALAKAKANPPDMAIVDVMMPGMTGYEVCRQMRAMPATADIPIIILTARGQDVDRQAALDAGADLYLAKPVTMGDLLTRVEALLTEYESSLGGGGCTTIAMLSLRGGVGTTTLAVNTAAFIARRTNRETCLVDLSASSGNAALQLGLRPNPNWTNLNLEQGSNHVDISPHLLEHSGGIRLLAAPFVPAIGDGLSEEMTSQILSSLQESFGFVVLDLPSVLNQSVMTALEMSDVVGLVLTPDPASLQTTVGTLQALKSFVNKMGLILNHITPGQHPSPQALEKVLRRKINGAVPFDPAQAQALSKGLPLAMNKLDSHIAQAIPRLMAALQPTST